MARAPSRPIPRSMAGPSLLAFILVSKFDDHIPLYRLNEIFARMGAARRRQRGSDQWRHRWQLLGPMAHNGSVYDIEREIAAKSADLWLAARKKCSADKVAAFKVWAEQQLTRIPGKSDLAKAFRYALNRWSSFTLFLDDGRIAIDNNAAERAMRPIGVGRKNWLFAGSDTGGETLARAMTLIESAKMSGLDPQAYLADALDRIHDHMSNRLDELLPWNRAPKAKIMPESAAA